MERVTHPDLASLHPTGYHPDRPDRITVLLEDAPSWRPGESADVADVARCHRRDYIERVRRITKPTWVEEDTICSKTSYEAALLAAGTAIVAVETGGFALVRPPGHHAGPDRWMGFCFFNNAAIAVRYAQAVLGTGRVAIVDFDAHHANGTQDIFRDDPTVLCASIHEWPWSLDTGGPDDQAPTTLNAPLPPGSGDEEWIEAFDRVVEPAVHRFRPELVVVSVGFDAHVDDPLSNATVTVDGFRELTRRCAALAPHVAAVLEGGYNLETLPSLVAAGLEGLSG